jgi:hypothetical protein
MMAQEGIAMLQPEQIEELICLVSVLDREALMLQFREIESSFPVDFTNEFLESLPLDRVRHIFLALCLQCRQLPRLVEEQVAA